MSDSWNVALTLSWLSPHGGDEHGDTWRRRAERDEHAERNEHAESAARDPRNGPATTIDGMSSDTIVARIRMGDREAFSALYLAFRDRLWRLAATLGESPDLAQEMVQELFLALWQRRATLVVRDDIAVYLLSAVRHRVYKATRHARVVARFRDVAARDMSMPNDGGPFDADVDADTLRRAIADALETVTARERAAVLLRWSEGRTYEEIGVVLGVSAMGAHKMVTRALARVRPLLERFRDNPYA